MASEYMLNPRVGAPLEPDVPKDPRGTEGTLPPSERGEDPARQNAVVETALHVEDRVDSPELAQTTGPRVESEQEDVPDRVYAPAEARVAKPPTPGDAKYMAEHQDDQTPERT
jgi:hypothetical protein